MIRRPPRSTQSRSSAASDVYKRQVDDGKGAYVVEQRVDGDVPAEGILRRTPEGVVRVCLLFFLSLIHISEPTRPY